MPTALITGATAGLGRSLADTLARHQWTLIIDGRRVERVQATEEALSPHTRTIAVIGDVSDPDHQGRLIEAVREAGPLDLLVNNASELGGSPQPELADLEPDIFARLLSVNVAAPLQLIREALPHLSESGAVVNISSDAAAEHYEGWGGYAATKAALDHLTLTFAAEHPKRRFYAVDPGDMRTAMHQDAFPGEDISDRPLPESVAPVLAALAESQLPSGRYRVGELRDRLGTAPDAFVVAEQQTGASR